MSTSNANPTTRPVAPSTPDLAHGSERCAGERADAQATDQGQSGRSVGPTVLIVESDLAVRLMLATSFDSAGYDVQLAHDLIAAQTAVGPANDRQSPSLLVIADDIGGASGLAFIQKLAEASPETMIPVILLSNASHRLAPSALVQTGVRHVVGKPCSCREILSYAADLVGFSGPAGPAAWAETGDTSGETFAPETTADRRAA